jgi:hypothetical protein
VLGTAALDYKVKLEIFHFASFQTQISSFAENIQENIDIKGGRNAVVTFFATSWYPETKGGHLV